LVPVARGLKRPFLDPQRGRTFRILDLEPAFHSPGSVSHVAPLGDNPLKAHPAGMFEDCRAIALQMLVIDDA
jgi:hypothetical protein